MTIKDLLGDAYKEGMTIEDVDIALSDINLPKDDSKEIERLKNAISKSNSEAAEYKRKLREHMTAEEQTKNETEEAFKKLQEEHEGLLRKISLSENTAKFATLGLDEKLASETAEALLNGDTAKLFDNLKKHTEQIEKKVRADVLKDTPKPTAESDNKTLTLKEFRSWSPVERDKFARTNPEEYAQLYSNEGGTN